MNRAGEACKQKDEKTGKCDKASRNCLFAKPVLHVSSIIRASGDPVTIVSPFDSRGCPNLLVMALIKTNDDIFVGHPLK
jgi:hypothetical protein